MYKRVKKKPQEHIKQIQENISKLDAYRDVDKGLDTLKKLRELDKGSLERYDRKSLEEIKYYFKSEEYEKDKFLNELLFRIEEGTIETEISGDIYKKEKNVLIHYLRNGQIYLTEFGKAYVEIFCYFRPYVEIKTQELNSKITEVDNKIEKLEKIQNSLYFQVFATMSIFVAILGFITQGIKLITIEGYFNLCFRQQFTTGIALFLPLAIIIFLIFLFAFIVSLINKNKK